jgi:hypothetical protein
MIESVCIPLPVDNETVHSGTRVTGHDVSGPPVTVGLVRVLIFTLLVKPLIAVMESVEDAAVPLEKAGTAVAETLYCPALVTIVATCTFEPVAALLVKVTVVA